MSKQWSSFREESYDIYIETTKVPIFGLNAEDKQAKCVFCYNEPRYSVCHKKHF